MSKYARIASDPSQITMFKNDLIDGLIGFPALPVDVSKSYSLVFAHGLVQWVADGEEPVYPVPDEPETKGKALLLSPDESVVGDAVIMPNTSVVDGAIIL